MQVIEEEVQQTAFEAVAEDEYEVALTCLVPPTSQ
jgi:hypothetical protein